MCGTRGVLEHRVEVRGLEKVVAGQDLEAGSFEEATAVAEGCPGLKQGGAVEVGETL